ncbi:MAG: response regulator [Verrucomicrobia bacterium]|nr:response regulator [Verrucomicrobiota bacterium]
MKSDSVFVLENAAWPALLLDGSGVVRQANRAAKELFGPALEENSTQFAALWAEDNASKSEAYLAQITQATPAEATLKFRVKGGESKTFKAGLCSTQRDQQRQFLFQLFPEPVAAETPKAESAGLLQKQKLDMALQLTRTVALDFNNALTSILGHTSLVLSRTDSSFAWRDSLMEVEKAAEKAAEIAHDLASFSRQERDTTQLVASNFNELIRRTVTAYQTPANAHIEWKLHLEGKLFSVLFDEAKMQQALTKILDNAVQAVGKDARITLLTRNREHAEPVADGTVTIPAGRYVMADISDNGGGIPANVLPRIFEPFFTTKNGQRGLGLAWAYGIITNAGGSIAVSSEPLRGTSVRIYLPALKKMVEDKVFSDEALRGTETILLVDDEDLMLKLGQTVLRSFGYRVIAANSGVKALELFTKRDRTIDLVLTDLVMPGMSGRELVEKLREIAPTLRIIGTSGYTRQAVGEDENYLQKPFTSHDLLRKVRQVLNEPAV